VALSDALDGCERILSDEFKDYPESALYMIGSIGEADGKRRNDPTNADDASPARRSDRA